KEHESSNVNDKKILYVPDNEFLKSLFVGFGNKTNNGLICGFGVIDNFANGVLEIKAKVEEFDTIFISDTKLDMI
ncbi:MAG: hypothetical protein L0H53_12285, partial [Candidatus Nitrosocosmicus sp.]|nr:hypothetical protein [Candidatus Nitrosocosmicus sp.]MDN5866130.1 hypothetical protein [Candidatus Nitrosocosmicus sp.]